MINNLKELVFGGYVSCGVKQDQTPLYLRVKLVNLEDGTVLLENGVICVAWQLNGIPITPDLLIKTGAYEVEKDVRFRYRRFTLIWKEAYKYWYVVDSESLTYMTKVEFLHEWENFIFVTEDVELYINF